MLSSVYPAHPRSMSLVQVHTTKVPTGFLMGLEHEDVGDKRGKRLVRGRLNQAAAMCFCSGIVWSKKMTFYKRLGTNLAIQACNGWTFLGFEA